VFTREATTRFTGTAAKLRPSVRFLGLRGGPWRFCDVLFD
jgi:hypothetical protein